MIADLRGDIETRRSEERTLGWERLVTRVALQLWRSIVQTPTLLLPELGLTHGQPPRYESSSDSNGTAEQFLGTSYRNIWEREALLLLGMQRMGDEA